MNRITSWRSSCGLSRSVLLCAAIFCICQSSPTSATVLPVGLEKDYWSDMAFPTGVTGNFNAGTQILTIGASPSNDLEIGTQFGPSNPGRHYGTGGTLGGPFGATMSVVGATIASNGSVTTGGTLTVILNGSAPGSIGDDYGVATGGVLLSGTITQVLLDATGDNTLDILFSILGGALQNPNPTIGEVFASTNYGLLRIGGVTLPSDWTGSFSLNGATIDVFGLPEPSSFLLAATVGLFSLLNRKR
jgi:hypothetical protein